MPLPERLTKTQIKEKFLTEGQRHKLDKKGDCVIWESILDEIIDEAYKQGTLCQHPSHGNRVGHFEEFVGTKTKES
jgi:hypothetical protein